MKRANQSGRSFYLKEELKRIQRELEVAKLMDVLGSECTGFR